VGMESSSHSLEEESLINLFTFSGETVRKAMNPVGFTMSIMSVRIGGPVL